MLHPNAKTFEIEVGSPSTGELLKKELGVEKGKKGGPDDPKTVGNLKFEQVVKVARMKEGGSLVRNVKQGSKEVLGTCVSLGITVDGKDPREIRKAVDAGEYDSALTG